VSIEFAHDRGATYPAKASVISWRAFIEGNGAFALQPFKVDCLRGGAASKGCAVRLATHRAMTIQGVEQPPIDLVFDAAAQAASAHHACTTLPTGAGCAANGVRGGEPTAATSISQPSGNIPAWN
jgi:hypothetical protein